MGTFIDLGKAFDTVDHDILVEKLEYYNLRVVSSDFLRLENITKYVRVNDVDSDVLNVKCGVPQGSVIGPVLINLYINNIFMHLENQKLYYLQTIDIYFIQANVLKT